MRAPKDISYQYLSIINKRTAVPFFAVFPKTWVNIVGQSCNKGTAILMLWGYLNTMDIIGFSAN